MAKKNSVQKERKIGRQQQPAKKPLIDPKHKNTIWTIVILAVLTVFFIVNNTREEPEEGPYPPNYNPHSSVLSQ